MTKTALLSVYDKTGVVDLGQSLTELGFDLVSSGGTAKVLREAGLTVTDVADLTGFPAILGHRVVTLHPKVHGGILAIPTDEAHQAELAEYGITPIDLVIVNLYPFQATVASGASFAECIEKIDVGGPTMVRAAAKNHAFVGILTDPADYEMVLAEYRENDSLSEETRLKLACKAFAHTADYDIAIVTYLSNGEYRGMIGRKVSDCDYGENKWQSPAALYETLGNTDELALSQLKVVAGRSPSFVNWTDVDRLLQTATHIIAGHTRTFGSHINVAVAVKHGNACGVGVGHTADEAVKRMLTGDPQAIFGAVVVTNFEVTDELADLLLWHETGEVEGKPIRRLLDGIYAPRFDEGAEGKLGRRDGKYFLGTNQALAHLGVDSLDTELLFRPVRGGFLVEPNYTFVLDLAAAEVNGDVGGLGGQESRDLITAWAICATSNSNTITLVKNDQLIGNGVGQQDRVGCCKLAVQKAQQFGHELEGAVAASDSFFPFPDGPQVLIDAGVSAIFSTTGSNRDGETQQLCLDRGVALAQLPDADARGFYRH